MAVCSYLVLTEPDTVRSVGKRIAALPGCDVVLAQNRDLLLLVTESEGPGEDEALRESLEAMDGISALVLTFGEVARARDRSGTLP